MLPRVTRLRWVSNKDPEVLTKYCEGLPYRVQIYSIIHNGSEYVMFFVPDDKAQTLSAHGKLKVKSKT